MEGFFAALPWRRGTPGILGIKNRTVFTFAAEGLTFTIMGQPVPPAALKKGLSAVLAASRDSLVTMHRGEAVSDKSIRVARFPAREFVVKSGSLEPNVILARSVLTGRRLYTLFVTGPEASVSGPSAQKFLDSFMPK